jgi:DNA polymerase-1
LRQHLAAVIRNRRINQLVCDLALPVLPADLVLQPWDRDEVHRIFDGLEFRVLRDRLFQTLTAVDETDPEAGFSLDGVQLAPGELGAWLADNTTASIRAGVQVVGSWGQGTGDVWSVAVATAAGAAAWFDTAEWTESDETAWARWLADPERPKALHDAKGPLLAMQARGWRLAGLTSDTALSAYLVRPDQRSYDLADLTVRYLKRELRSDDDDSGQLSFEAAGDDASAARYAMLRARAVVDLAEALDSELKRQEGAALLREVELPLVSVLAGIEAVGICADVDHLSSLESHFAAAVKDAAESAYALIGKEINLGSPKQLQVVLFDELGMPKTKRPRPDTRPTPTRCSHCSRRPSTRSCPACSPTATPHACVRPSRACSSPSRTTAGFTRRSTSSSPRPGGCRRLTRTCRTSPSAPRRAAAFGRRSSSARATTAC